MRHVWPPSPSQSDGNSSAQATWARLAATTTHIPNQPSMQMPSAPSIHPSIHARTQVMASFDDYVMTPHSSFSELGATLSHTWRRNPRAAVRMLPNRPIVPLFPGMNEFERRKAFSLLDRRAVEIVPPPAGGGQCMRSHAAGMSLAVAKGRELLSMFEAIEDAPCMQGKGEGIAAL